MRHSIRTSLVGFLLAGLVGCTGTVGGTGTGGTGTGTGNSTGTGTGNSTGTGTGNSTGTGTGNSTGTGTGGSAGTGTGGAAGTTPNPTITCAPGIPATTQLRRMLNWQYDATVRDLLGLTSITSGSAS